MRRILGRLMPGSEPRLSDCQPIRPEVELRVTRILGLNYIRLQELQHHLLGLASPSALARNRHPLTGCSTTGWSERAFPFDLHNADPTISIRTESVFVAKMRDLDAMTLGDLENRFPCFSGDRAAIERKFYAFSLGNSSHQATPLELV
jgi:hypothetical protein